MKIVQEKNIDNLDKDNHQVVKEIMRKFSKTPCEYSISFLGAGSCNTNYLVKTEKGHVVVKLSKPEREYKAAAEYKKETWCLSTVDRLGIPSPKVLDTGETQGRVYMIQSYIEGTTAADMKGNSSLPIEVQLKIWRTLGGYAKKIHSINVAGWGEELVDDGIFKGNWEKHLQYNIDSLTDNDDLIARRIITEKESTILRKKFLELQQKSFTFKLNHGDLALRNVIITAKGEVYLLDWGTARAEIVPHFDINEILRSTKPDTETLQAFLDGYGISKQEFDQMKLDLNTLNILHEVDTLRWAIDRMPSAIDQHVLRVKDALASSCMFSLTSS